MMSRQYHLQVSKNLHGKYNELINALAQIGFNFGDDRLFSVGDLVDKGKDSKKVVDLLQKDWFHAIRGNHE
jgi:serine/threonine protein phosphatase 1